MTATTPESRLEAVLRRMDGLINWERDRSERIRHHLGPVAALLGRLGDPHAGPGAPRWVHVTGTKGKGSVCDLVAGALRRAGWRVGVYGSPHVERVNERVRIDGEDVADDLLAEGLERALEARGGGDSRDGDAAEATWFDTLTAAAFWIFGREQVDWVVCEVGLGGRLDSTNVIQPEVCAITNIDLEHTHVLGDTHLEIAREKGGILKAGASFVCGLDPEVEGDGPSQDGERQAAAHLLERAAELDMPVHFPEDRGALGISARNRGVARAVLGALGERGRKTRDGEPIGPEHLLEAVPTGQGLPGRLERWALRGTPVVLDGAHVASSVALALEELQGRPDLPGKPVAVLSLAVDKDARGILKALRSTVDRVVCTTIPSGRHQSASALCELAREAGLEASACPEPNQAVSEAVDLAASGWVLAIGSLYLAGAVRAELRRANEC